MKARLEDWKKTLSQPWLLSLLMVAVIPLFPEYIAPLLAIGAVVAANADAKRRGRVLSVGPIGKLLLIFMLYTAFGVLYSKHPFNSFATFLMWMVMFLAYLSMTTVLTNRHPVRHGAVLHIGHRWDSGACRPVSVCPQLPGRHPCAQPVLGLDRQHRPGMDSHGHQHPDPGDALQLDVHQSQHRG